MSRREYDPLLDELLKASLREPDCLATRNALADYLSERGDGELAEAGREGLFSLGDFDPDGPLSSLIVRCLRPEGGFEGRDAKIEVSRLEKGDGYRLWFYRMYETVELSFRQLDRLSRLFGTENIDVDQYSEGGCESCDYGSRYGHEIDLREVARFGSELNVLVGKTIRCEE